MDELEFRAWIRAVCLWIFVNFHPPPKKKPHKDCQEYPLNLNLLSSGLLLRFFPPSLRLFISCPTLAIWDKSGAILTREMREKKIKTQVPVQFVHYKLLPVNYISVARWLMIKGGNKDTSGERTHTSASPQQSHSSCGENGRVCWVNTMKLIALRAAQTPGLS